MTTYCLPSAAAFAPSCALATLLCTAACEELSREEAGTTGAIVEEKRVCWFGISDGTMYSGVLAPGYA